jgi:hypothetical protein
MRTADRYLTSIKISVAGAHMRSWCYGDLLTALREIAREGLSKEPFIGLTIRSSTVIQPDSPTMPLPCVSETLNPRDTLLWSTGSNRLAKMP